MPVLSVREKGFCRRVDGGVLQAFRTDAEGRLELPVHEEKLGLNFLTQFVAHAKIYVESEGVDNLIWYSPKMTPEIYSETDAPLDGFVCNLDTERVVVNMSRWNVMTRCEWVSMPE